MCWEVSLPRVQRATDLNDDIEGFDAECLIVDALCNVAELLLGPQLVEAGLSHGLQ